MKFLIDNQLPIALSRWLSAQGVESNHVLDIHLDEVSDHQIWQYAKTHGVVIISKDEDFVYLAKTDLAGPAVVWVRLGNCRNAALLETFNQLLPQLLKILSTGQKVVEIR
jgi:predicted nuclease of predicted toxin-antitoxin system